MAAAAAGAAQKEATGEKSERGRTKAEARGYKILFSQTPFWFRINELVSRREKGTREADGTREQSAKGEREREAASDSQRLSVVAAAERESCNPSGEPCWPHVHPLPSLACLLSHSLTHVVHPSVLFCSVLSPSFERLNGNQEKRMQTAACHS